MKSFTCFCYLCTTENTKSNMKKILVTAIAVLMAVGASGQRGEGSVTVQPRAGVNFSSMDEYNRTKFGYTFGMEVEYQMTDMLSLSGAIMYSDQGAKDKDEEGKEEIFDMDFVNIPILVNCYVAPEVMPGLAVKVGVQPAFRTKASVRYDGMKYDVDWLFKELDLEDTKLSKFMLSVPVGLSYEYNNLVFDARYNFGITDLFKGEGKLRNNVVQLTLGYKFDAVF